MIVELVQNRLSPWHEKYIPEPNSGCWLWLGRTGHYGYGLIKHPDGSTTGAHRAFYERHRGHIPKGMFICHKCDQPSCVNPDHLYAGTPADNARDMTDRGRHHRWDGSRAGEGNPHRKMTEREVRACRYLMDSGVPPKTVAKAFNVSSSHMNRIRAGQKWGGAQP